MKKLGLTLLSCRKKKLIWSEWYEFTIVFWSLHQGADSDCQSSKMKGWQTPKCNHSTSVQSAATEYIYKSSPTTLQLSSHKVIIVSVFLIIIIIITTVLEVQKVRGQNNQIVQWVHTTFHFYFQYIQSSVYFKKNALLKTIITIIMAPCNIIYS